MILSDTITIHFLRRPNSVSNWQDKVHLQREYLRKKLVSSMILGFVLRVALLQEHAVMPARSACLVPLSLSEAGPRRFGG